MRFARWAGIGLTLLCLAYFLRSLLALEPKRLLSLPVDGLLVSLAVWSSFYALLLVGVCLGFVSLVQASGFRRAASHEAIVIWGKANMAKYLPGNVLHFAGRQVLAARFGWPQGSVAAASLLEVGLQLLLPCTMAFLALLAFGHLAMLEASPGWLVPIVLAVLAVLALIFSGQRLTRWLPARVLALLDHLDLHNPRALLSAMGWYLLFFVGMSLIIWSLFTLVIGYVDLRHLPILSAAFLISWVMGFVIPGAPGGIGIREGAFAALGGIFLNSEALVIVAVLMRLVTLAGEGLIFILALRLSRSTAAARVASAPARPAERGATVLAAPRRQR